MADAMAQISKSDIAKVKFMLYGIKNGATKAMVTAINSTIKTTKTQVKKKVGQTLNLPAARINKDLKYENANYQKISGKISFAGEPVGLVSFGATHKPSWTGVHVRVYRSAPLSKIKHSFIANSKGSKNVFWRSKKGGKRVARLPIERLTGPRIEDVLAKPEIIGPINETAGELLKTNLGKKVDEILRRNK